MSIAVLEKTGGGNPNHDEHGRFASGRGQSILDKPIIHSSQGFGEGVEPTLWPSVDFGAGTFGGRTRLGPNAADRYGHIETVQLCDVYATQDVVQPFIVDQYAHGERPVYELPRLLRYNGKLHVDDGHHRLEAARLNGETSIRAIVVDVDKHGLPLKWIDENPESAREAIQIHEMRQREKSPSRLTILRKALEVTHLALDIKRQLLSKELKKAVVRGVHLKQAEQAEKELTDALVGLFKEQFKAAANHISKDGKTEFNPRDWDDALVDTCMPVLMKHAGLAAAAQMMLMGVDVSRRKRKMEKSGGGNPNHDEHGGFASGAYTATEGKDRSGKPDRDDVLNIVADVRDRWGYQGGVSLVDGQGGEFERGGLKWRTAGQCQIAGSVTQIAGSVTIWRDTDWSSVESVVSLTAHEMMHGTYQKIQDKYDGEQKQLTGDHIRMNGQLKEEYRDQFPVYARMWELYQGSRNPKVGDDQWFQKDDGVSEYSKAYWRDYEAGKCSLSTAIHETLAEIAGEHESTGVLVGSRRYRDFYKAVRDEYRVEIGQSRFRRGPGVPKKSVSGHTEIIPHELYFDADFRPTNPENARYVRYWNSDGTTGIGVRSEEQKSPSHLTIRTKTTATDFLQNLEDYDVIDLSGMVFTLPSGLEITLGFMTEWPEWMKVEIVDQIKVAFSQGYWVGINDTTANGIESYVQKGLENGDSIADIRAAMVGDGLDEYYFGRGKNIARTEAGNVLNGARSSAMNRLQEEIPGLQAKKTWLSVLGTTTRDTHAHLDGVPADEEGMWVLAGIQIPWPGHFSLPPGERCSCQCSIVHSWGMGDSTAEGLIADYNERLQQEKSNPNHDPRSGRFSSGSGGSQQQKPASTAHTETVHEISSKIKKSSDNLEGGANVTKILEIEAGGITKKAIFKPIDGENPHVNPAFLGRQSICEVASSIVSEEMGLDLVAKTAMVTVSGKRGSLASWVNDTATLAVDLIEERFAANSEEKMWMKLSSDGVKGVNDMVFFDVLTGNADRHLGNWLVKNGEVKPIDNGMSFARNDEYMAGGLRFRTLESAPKSMAYQSMSPAFKAGLGNLLENRDKVDARLENAGLDHRTRDSFWKRAVYLSKTRMLGINGRTLHDVARLSEGLDLFASVGDIQTKMVDGVLQIEIDLKTGGGNPNHDEHGRFASRVLTQNEIKAISEWREHLWNRGIVTKLAQETIRGGSLAKYHPGEMMVYRGGNMLRTGSSWSKSREVAEEYADGGRIEELHLTLDTPALDINRVLSAIPSKSERDEEVFIPPPRRKSNPNHDEHGRFASGNGSSGSRVFYRGTTEAAVRAILRDGMHPGKGGGAEEDWETGIEDGYGGEDEIISAGRRASVYFTSDIEIADRYAKRASELRGRKPVILEIHIPTDASSPIKPDGSQYASYRVEQSIPAAWIKRYDKSKVKADNTGSLWYAVVHVPIRSQDR